MPSAGLVSLGVSSFAVLENHIFRIVEALFGAMDFCHLKIRNLVILTIVIYGVGFTFNISDHFSWSNFKRIAGLSRVREVWVSCTNMNGNRVFSNILNLRHSSRPVITIGRVLNGSTIGGASYSRIAMGLAVIVAFIVGS